MPATARGLGTTTAALAAMTTEQQIEWLSAYFLPYKGRLKTWAEVYMTILWPAGIGTADDWTLSDQVSRSTTYRQNAGLDANQDGKITKVEAAAKVLAKLERGRLPQFQWEGA